MKSAFLAQIVGSVNQKPTCSVITGFDRNNLWLQRFAAEPRMLFNTKQNNLRDNLKKSNLGAFPYGFFSAANPTYLPHSFLFSLSFFLNSDCFSDLVYKELKEQHCKSCKPWQPSRNEPSNQVRTCGQLQIPAMPSSLSFQIFQTSKSKRCATGSSVLKHDGSILVLNIVCLVSVSSSIGVCLVCSSPQIPNGESRETLEQLPNI